MIGKDQKHMSTLEEDPRIDRVIGSRLRTALRDEPRGAPGFGIRLGDFLGTEWGKQSVYDACQGLRKFRVTEIVALAQATNRPAHYFLDAEALGLASVEVADGKTVSAGALRNLFRIPEPRQLDEATRMAVSQIEGAIETLEAERQELLYAVRLLRDDQS